MKLKESRVLKSINKYLYIFVCMYMYIYTCVYVYINFLLFVYLISNWYIDMYICIDILTIGFTRLPYQCKSFVKTELRSKVLPEKRKHTSPHQLTHKYICMITLVLFNTATCIYRHFCMYLCVWVIRQHVLHFIGIWVRMQK